MKLPVLVYLHGGGYNFGSSDSKLYAPDYLMDQNIILVTLNYRLNIFGEQKIIITGYIITPFEHFFLFI